MTIIHRRHRFIYLKSAKTAGTAVEAHLLTRTPLGGDIWRSAGNVRRYGLPRDRRRLVLGTPGGRLFTAPVPSRLRRFCPRTRLILEHHSAASLARLLGSFWDGALKAVNIRNPWDMMVSAWQWRREGRGQSPPVTAEFSEWLSAALSGDPEWQGRVHAYDPEGLVHQYLFVDGRRAVDVLIRREDIQAGFVELGERLGLSIPPIEINENRSARTRDYRDYYTDELAEAVRARFARVIDFGDYRFDP